MAAEEDAEAGTAPAPAVLGELEHDAVEAYGIVEGHDPLLLVTEDLFAVAGAKGDKGRGGIGGGAAEFGVEGGQKALAQIPVGPGNGVNPRHPELVDAAVPHRGGPARRTA